MHVPGKRGCIRKDASRRAGQSVAPNCRERGDASRRLGLKLQQDGMHPKGHITKSGSERERERGDASVRTHRVEWHREGGMHRDRAGRSGPELSGKRDASVRTHRVEWG
jgi:hypothetical protein